MLSLEKFDVFFDSLRLSLNHCQYEFGGKYPFDKDIQYALGANEYSSMTGFRAEFQSWLFNADKERLEPYITSVYEKITHYGVFFVELVKSYESRFICNDGRASLDITKYEDLLKSESYRLVKSYAVAIGHLADEIRGQAFKYAKILLKPFRDLNLDSYNIHGNFIPELPPAVLEPPAEDIDVKPLNSFDVYIKEDCRDKIMPFLIKTYQGKKPKQFGYMIFALDTMGIMSLVEITANLTQFHLALEGKFGKCSTRQRLQQLIEKLDKAANDDEVAIRAHIQAIKEFLHP